MTLNASPTPRRRPRAGVPAAAAAALLTALAVVPAATAAWVRPADGPSPINQSPASDAADAAAASVGGVPYVAWRESDGTNAEVRVARLTAAGWERVGQALNPASPVNRDSLGNAGSVALADVGGVPHVAWTESDGTNAEVWVARPNAAGTGWDRLGTLVRPASPINRSPSRSASHVRIAGIGGIPYVTWAEGDGRNTEIRVARLDPAGTGWTEVGTARDAASPVNRSPVRDAREPVIAGVGGVPYVAWSEEDGTNAEIRVSRLNPAGTAWDPVGQALRPGSPVNQNASRDGRAPSLADVAGVPYVAWTESQPGGAQVRVARLSTGGAGWEKVGQLNEPARPVNAGTRGATGSSIAAVAGRPWVAWAEDDGTNREVRVARLNATERGWEQPAGGASPLNASAVRSADAPSLADVGGMPYVAWAERDGAGRQIRVGRLEPTVLDLSATAAERTLRMSARLRSYGLPTPVGFAIATAAGAQSLTRPGPLSGDPAGASAAAFDLAPGTVYRWRPYWVVGAGLIATGPEAAATTARVTALRVGARTATLRARPGRVTGLRLRSSTRAVATIRVLSGRRVVKSLRARLRPGTTVVRLRVPRRVGVYRVRVIARATGGRVSTTTVRLRVVPRLKR